MKKRRKSTLLHEGWSESTLSISDVPEPYVENSLGLWQRFGINQPSGRAQLTWHHIPKLRVPRENAENRHFCTKSDLKVLYVLVMFLKLMWRIVEVYSNVLVLISQVAALNWSDTIYPNLGYPVKHSENRHFCTKSDLKVLYPLVMFLKLILRIVEVYSNVLVLISQVAALNWSDTIYPNLGYPHEKTPKIDTFARKVIWKYFIH